MKEPKDLKIKEKPKSKRKSEKDLGTKISSPPKGFFDIIWNYEKYLATFEIQREKLDELELLNKNIKEIHVNEEIANMVEKEKDNLTALSREDIDYMFAHPDFLLFITEFGMNLSNLESRTGVNKIIIQKLKEFYDFCISSHLKLIEKVCRPEFYLEDDLTRLKSIGKFLFTYPRIAHYDAGRYTDNRESVLKILLEIYHDDVRINVGNKTVIEISCENALDNLMNSDLLEKYYYRTSHITYILEHLIREIPTLFTVLKLKLIKLFDFLFYQISPGLYYEEDKYLLWLFCVCCKCDDGFNDVIVSKIFPYEGRERYTPHQLFIIERMIAMFTEIDENIIKQYEILYDAAFDDLEEPNYSLNMHFNALGIINSFWACFELNTDGEKVIHSFFNHEDEGIQELAKHILDK